VRPLEPGGDAPSDRLLAMAAGTTPDASPADTVSAAAAAGFGGAGIWFDPASWSGAVTREVRNRLRATGLLALDIEPVIVSADGDPGERLVEAGVEVGARHVLVASRHPDRSATIERFGALCDRAAEGGLTVVLEFLPIFAVRTLSDALQVVQAAGRPNAGVLVDTVDVGAFRATVASAAQQAGARLLELTPLDDDLESVFRYLVAPVPPEPR